MSIKREALSNQPVTLSTLEPSVFKRATPWQLAWQDIKEGLKMWPIWLMLAYQDIKLRYRRSVFGPFWITISMAITVYSMGFLYAQLFKQDLQNYYPFLVSGMLSWSLISTMILEGTDGIMTADGFIKQVKLPYSLYLQRIAARNFIIFAHNSLVMIPVYFLFSQSAQINANFLFLFPSLILLYFNCVTFGLVLAMIGARYRDISQMIKSLVSVIFFITPIMWSPAGLHRHYYFIDLNPFFAFIEFIRAPLLGHFPTSNNCLMVGAMTVLGFVTCLAMFSRYRARIVYWL
jgi:ABC-type polysaccharide/polyol phosphate export permease